MKDNKNIIMVALCVLILIMATGYAFFATRLTINATGSITGNWNIYFSNITSGTVVGSASNKVTPSVSGTTANIEANLVIPGDSITYEITLLNAGNIGAIIENIDAKTEGTSAIVYTVSGIKVGDRLPAGASTIITIKVEYDENVEVQPDDTSKSLVLTIDCVQDVGQVITPSNPTVVAKLSEQILSNNDVQSDANIDFGQISSDTNGKGLYSTTTINGKVYYFRGDVNNNYVQFGEYQKDDAKYHPGVLEHPETFSTYEECIESDTAASWGGDCLKEGGNKGEPMYWRIVRINEDGTIKLVYVGTSIDTVTGQLLEVDGNSPVYSLETDYTQTTRKTMVEKWYTDHLESVYGSYIADNSFCNDLDVFKTETVEYNGYSYTDNYYMGYDRVISYKPTYNCSSSNSLSVANGKLSKPVGILAIDEVMYAGGVLNQSNTSYYLKGISTVTMTPSNYDSTTYSSNLIYGLSSGTISTVANNQTGLLLTPVINLKANVEVVGSGTIDNPYRIQTN